MNINDAIFFTLEKYCVYCDKEEECNEACAEAADYFNNLVEDFPPFKMSDIKPVDYFTVKNNKVILAKGSDKCE